MPIPGRNNLALAMRLIGSQAVTLHPYLGRALNAAGQYVPLFAPSRRIRAGSVQPVQQDRYERLGLDHAKQYVQWWAPAHVMGVERDATPDEFTWNGHRYSVARVTDWHAQDGWVVVTAARVEPAREAPAAYRRLRATVDSALRSTPRQQLRAYAV